MGRIVKRVVEYTEETGLSEVTQTKSIISKSSEIGIDPNAKPPEMKNMWEFPEDKRGSARYTAEFEVAVMRSGVSFKTKTVNVSASGILLKDNIPSSLVNQAFELMMTYKEVVNGQTIQHIFPIMARALGAPFRTPRLQFVTISPAVKEKLEKCLQNFKRIS
jgi:hypothetical protein